jgi:FkbH-like protein
MKLLKYSEIISRNREMSLNSVGKTYKLVLLSNIVINQLGDILEFELRSHGINATVVFGDYDNIVQDSARFQDVDAAILFWEASSLVDGLHASADAMDSGELDALAQRVECEIALVTANLRKVPLVLFNRFSSLLFSQVAIRDSALEMLCSKLNSALDRNVAMHHMTINMEKVMAQIGLAAVADFRQFQLTKSLYTIELYKTYVDYVAPIFYAIAGKMRKVLVLDCDNTLWGGILGEDGDSQIQMNPSTRAGRVFGEVQQIVKGFRKQGVLLALCSKNNPADVNRILSSHPDMLLRDSELVAKKVNWEDKATNLRELAAELNLGLDSFVFVDDSSFEIGLIQEQLPQVCCVKVPDSLSDYPATMRRVAREFFVISRTAEDMQKTEMYRQEHARDEVKAQFNSIDDYLISLGLGVRITWRDDESVARMAQLSQKTNQFNLTTRRYTESDITRMLSDDSFVVALISVSDRYGNYGITGLAVVRLGSEAGVANIEALLMSCRIIGRNIERVFFDHLVGRLQSKGVTKLYAQYLRTAKNDQVSGYYDSLGLQMVSSGSGEQKYELSLIDYRQSGINYIEVTEDAK